MPPHSDPVAAPDIRRFLQRHARLFATVVACAAAVVATKSPPRLDLWTAEWMGTAVFLAIPPLVLMRWLRRRDSFPMLLLVVAMAIGLAQAKRAEAQGDEPPRALPTASDGFGAYARFHD